MSTHTTEKSNGSEGHEPKATGVGLLAALSPDQRRGQPWTRKVTALIENGLGNIFRSTEGQMSEA